jgi:hypothetical protein
MDLLVKNIPSGILVILTPLYNLPPNIPDGNPGMIFHLRPSIVRSIILPITPVRERIELAENSSTSMEVLSESIGLFDRSESGRNGSDERYRLWVDGKVVVEGVVEQGEKMRDLGVDL